jgi:hypothetical protein
MTNTDIIKDKINDLKATMEALLPHSRERSTALTKLDECRHWVTDIDGTPLMGLPDSIGVSQN